MLHATLSRLPFFPASVLIFSPTNKWLSQDPGAALAGENFLFQIPSIHFILEFVIPRHSRRFRLFLSMLLRRVERRVALVFAANVAVALRNPRCKFAFCTANTAECIRRRCFEDLTHSRRINFRDSSLRTRENIFQRFFPLRSG